MCYATPVQHKIGTDKIIQRYTHSTWIFYTFRKWFQTFTPAQPEIFAKISLYTKLVQPDFSYISKIWFQDSTPAQPEIFGDDMVVHYTRTTWLSRHLYNLISGFYTCATWNLYLYGKVTYFTLHSHTLIFITLAKHDFRGFFILVVCRFSYIYIFRTYIYVKTKSLPFFCIGNLSEMLTFGLVSSEVCITYSRYPCNKLWRRTECLNI